MSHGTLIGVTYCVECSQKINIHEKHRRLIGTVVRCPACRHNFTLQLETASAVDRAMDEEKSRKTKKRTRRGKSELRDATTRELSAALKALHPRLKQLKTQRDTSEEDIRVWCRDVLITAFGFDDTEIGLEQAVPGGGATDIEVAVDGRVLFIVECKKSSVNLNPKHIDQAVGYAQSLTLNWAVVTNGDIWRLYRIVAVRGKYPLVHEVFDVALLDEDGVSDADADRLYLLTKRCMTSREIEDEWEKEHASSRKHLMKALFSEKVVKAMRIQLNDSYREEYGKIAALDDERVREEMEDCFLAKELGS